MEPIRLKMHQITLDDITEADAINMALFINDNSCGALKASSLAMLNRKYDLSELEIREIKSTLDEYKKIQQEIKDADLKLREMDKKVEAIKQKHAEALKDKDKVFEDKKPKEVSVDKPVNPVFGKASESYKNWEKKNNKIKEEKRLSSPTITFVEGLLCACVCMAVQKCLAPFK